MTGNLRDVMKESATAALTYARSRNYGRVDFDATDFHLHFPEGAVPKDGPSAGTAITTALVSLLTGRAVKKNVAMTGEVTITGRVLPVGGIKEKFLAAYREGVKTIYYPHTNEKDVSEVPEEIRKELNLIPVDNVEQVLEGALEKGKEVSKKASKSTFEKSEKKTSEKPVSKKKTVLKKKLSNKRG
jgi:ATP-dependent Lon protease